MRTSAVVAESEAGNEAAVLAAHDEAVGPPAASVAASVVVIVVAGAVLLETVGHIGMGGCTSERSDRGRRICADKTEVGRHVDAAVPPLRLHLNTFHAGSIGIPVKKPRRWICGGTRMMQASF